MIAGGGAVAGVGFTVSILISSLAFDGQPARGGEARRACRGDRLAAGGLGVFQVVKRLPDEVRARQIAGTYEDLLDLSEDVDPDRDHIRGSERGPVTLVEYGDYECPYCGRAEVVVRELLDSFGDDLRYVWRHLPLNDVHPNAQMAAEAAEAAGAQGAFWEMNDRLLQHQDQLTPPRPTPARGGARPRCGSLLGGAPAPEYADRVAEDVASADASGVAGTPGFFINGRRHQGAYDIETLTSAVRGARDSVRIRSTSRPAEPERVG